MLSKECLYQSVFVGVKIKFVKTRLKKAIMTNKKLGPKSMVQYLFYYLKYTQAAAYIINKQSNGLDEEKDDWD